MSDEAKMALDGLEMGYRVIGSRLKEVMRKSKRKVYWECDPMNEGDSMRVARELLCVALRTIPKLQFDGSQTGRLRPWSLGYLNGTLNPMFYVELGDHPDNLEHSLAYLESMSADWYADQWRELIIEPVERHHDEWVRWIKSSATVGTFDDETREAIELCKVWCKSLRKDGGPTPGERQFLETLITLGGNAEWTQIEKAGGFIWETRRGARAYMDKINLKLSKLRGKRSQRWKIFEDKSQYLIRLKT